MSALPPYQGTGSNFADLVMVLDRDLEAHAATLRRAVKEVHTCVVADGVSGVAVILPAGTRQVAPAAALEAQLRGLVPEGEVLLLAPEPVLQQTFAALMQTPPDAATVRFLPGCITRIQPLPGRAVLRHLNLGGA